MDQKKALKKAASRQDKNVEDFKKIAEKIKREYLYPSDTLQDAIDKVLAEDGLLMPDYLMEKAQKLKDPRLKQFAEDYEELFEQEKDTSEKEDTLEENEEA